MHAPANPTRAEVDEHESTGHVQYRTWCRHCVAGRGLGQQHRSRDEESKRDDGLPIIASDYTFMTTDEGRRKSQAYLGDQRQPDVVRGCKSRHLVNLKPEVLQPADGFLGELCPDLRL